MTKEFWNERYAENEFVYGKEPNAFFKQKLTALKPGKLLLPCDGEGRNAVYAATQNWEVYAFDQSEMGKEKCMQLAHHFNVALNYEIADALEIDLGENVYDLIALIYAHFPATIRNTIHQKCIRALKPGATLILEAFNPLQLNNNSGGPKATDMLYTKTILATDFSDLKIEYLEELNTNLDEGLYHIGVADVIRLVATK